MTVTNSEVFSWFRRLTRTSQRVNLKNALCVILSLLCDEAVLASEMSAFRSNVLRHIGPPKIKNEMYPGGTLLAWQISSFFFWQLPGVTDCEVADWTVTVASWLDTPGVWFAFIKLKRFSIFGIFFLLSQAPQASGARLCISCCPVYLHAKKKYIYHSGHVADANCAPLSSCIFFLRHYTNCSNNHDNFFACILFPRLCISCVPGLFACQKKYIYHSGHVADATYASQFLARIHFFFAPLHNMPKQPR